MANKNDAARDIRDLISNLGLGIKGTNLFCDWLPDKDVTTICVNASGGEMGEDLAYEDDRPRVQITVQSPKGKNSECSTKIWALYNALHGLTNQVINGNTYVQIMAIQLPYDIGYSNSQQYSKAFNLLIHRNS